MYTPTTHLYKYHEYKYLHDRESKTYALPRGRNIKWLIAKYLSKTLDGESKERERGRVTKRKQRLK